MLSIGKKKYRNLQEQVGYNTEEIEKIKDLIDGIVFDDKLVVIDSASGSLSEAQMEVLDGPLAFISYNEKVYLKTSESATELVFKAIDIKAEEVGSAYFDIGGSKVVITIATKVYTVSDDLIITTYSKSQLDSIVSNLTTLINGKIGLSDLVLSNIKDSAGNSRFVEGDISLETVSGLTKKYGKWSLSGTHLQLVLALELDANSSISLNTILASISLPSWIGEKIFPTKMTGVVSGYVEAKKFPVTLNGYNLDLNKNAECYIYKVANNLFQIYCWGVSSNEADQYFRVEFDLLIDNNY